MSYINSWNLYFPEDEYTPLNGTVRLVEACKAFLTPKSKNESKTLLSPSGSDPKELCGNKINKTKNICTNKVELYLKDINKNPIVFFSLKTLEEIIPEDILYNNLQTSLESIGCAISDILFSYKYEIQKVYVRILTYEDNLEVLSTHQNGNKLISKMENHQINNFSTICAEKIENLIFFKGTVVRVGSKKIKITRPVYRCFKCRKLQVSKQKVVDEVDRVTDLNASERTPKIEDICLCLNRMPQSNKFNRRAELALEHSEIKDYQEIKIQEPDKAESNLIEVILFDDLVGSIAPGDVVSIVGSIKAETDNSVMYKLIIHANNLEKINIHQTRRFENNSINAHDYKMFEKISRDKNIMQIFSSTLFPNIIGHEHILFALILSLFGGSTKSYGSVSSRKDIHILLIGDPGLGKSRILIDLINIIPKSVYVCGTMTSTAGLTVSLTHEDGDFVAEAGALILSNNGICAIDEFDKMQGASKSILEVMEEQVVSIAKGGVICNIPTKCSIIAAANPKFGKFKQMGQVSGKMVKDALKVERNVISRFDCVFLMKDSEDNLKKNLIKKIKEDALRLAGFRENRKEVKKEIKKEEFEEIKRKLKEQINENQNISLKENQKENSLIEIYDLESTKEEIEIKEKEESKENQKREEKDSDEDFDDFLKEFNENSDTLEIIQTIRDDAIFLSNEKKNFENLYEKKILVKYILHARNSVNPKITEDSKKYLKEFFTEILNKSQMPNTDAYFSPSLRTLETLMRLAESFAKMKLKSEVSLEDCKFIISIFKKSLLGSFLDPQNQKEKKVTGKKQHFFEILKNTGKKEFSMQEIKDIYAKEIENIRGTQSFDRLIQQLNEKGFLIKKSKNLFKFVY